MWVKPLPPVPHPVNLNLESTLGCNLECVMCGSHLSGVTKMRRSMDKELLARVEAQVVDGIDELSLTVAGEPFLTPRLPQFVAVAERNGAELSLNTNATLLKDTGLLRRVMRQSSVLRFSVDGATAAESPWATKRCYQQRAAAPLARWPRRPGVSLSAAES